MVSRVSGFTHRTPSTAGLACPSSSTGLRVSPEWSNKVTFLSDIGFQPDAPDDRLNLKGRRPLFQTGQSQEIEARKTTRPGLHASRGGIGVSAPDLLLRDPAVPHPLRGRLFHHTPLRLVALGRISAPL